MRASRSATIRTRLDRETIRERLSTLAAGSPPSEGPLEKGHFLGGAVGTEEFHFEFRFASQKNTQNYSVHGRVGDHQDWRVLRLKLTAHDPWLGRIELAFLAGFVLLHVVLEEAPAGGGVLALLFVMSIYAFFNLMYVPDVVTSRVAGTIASEVNGSVRIGDAWVVPR